MTFIVLLWSEFHSAFDLLRESRCRVAADCRHNLYGALAVSDRVKPDDREWGVMQPAAYCYQILRCAAAATTGASDPCYQPPMPVCQSFAKYFPDTSLPMSACASVSMLASFSPPWCDESSVWRDTAADSGGCRPGLGSNWFLCSDETPLLYTASDNYNEARCWENIMGGGLSVSCDEPIVCVMRPGNYQPRNARLEIRLIIHHWHLKYARLSVNWISFRHSLLSPRA